MIRLNAFGKIHYGLLDYHSLSDYYILYCRHIKNSALSTHAARQQNATNSARSRRALGANAAHTPEKRARLICGQQGDEKS